MLVIRLTRIGKNKEVAYRMVLAEKSKAVKGAYQESFGYYNPAEQKKLSINVERALYWISKGARPSPTAAGLLKKSGAEGMEKFRARTKKPRKAKNAPAEEKLVAPVQAPEENPEVTVQAPEENPVTTEVIA